ncbi:sulfotransferase domain-containing protein [Pontivivens ytuae]|uniref:Sulfotransferase n=1 Tax=Pontivivens ytuae TaxID=2789856 RepID=A0A7S9QEG7_9RHOB|nr:sulfotransferase [Pontivivens ytuae]QPH55955.1 sulfotransferase [Pontivivens ytuae]
MSSLVLPDLIIAGAPKSGSTSLFRWLSDHPDVVGSLEKETYFLVDPGSHMHRPDRHVSRGLEGYANLFPTDANDGRVRVEATPAYMVHETARAAVQDMPSKPLVLFILREPVAQIKSSYDYFRNNWHWIPPGMRFDEWVGTTSGPAAFRGNELAGDPMGTANYVHHLRAWRDAVGAERMIVCLFEDMRTNPKAFMRSLAERLGISPSHYDSYHFPIENESYAVRSHALQRVNIALRQRLPKGAVYNAIRTVYRAFNTTPATRLGSEAAARTLKERFAAENAALAQEFDLDLSPWREANAS